MDMGIPPLKHKIQLESNPLEPRVVVRILAVGSQCWAGSEGLAAIIVGVAIIAILYMYMYIYIYIYVYIQ